VMVCSGIQDDPVAQWTMGSSVPYLLWRVLLGIPWLILAVRGMR
jgi:hypothetical protein